MQFIPDIDSTKKSVTPIIKSDKEMNQPLDLSQYEHSWTIGVSFLGLENNHDFNPLDNDYVQIVGGEFSKINDKFID